MIGKRWAVLAFLLAIILCTGCVSKMFIPAKGQARSATNQWTVTRAVDRAVDKLEFGNLKGKKVFLLVIGPTGLGVEHTGEKKTPSAGNEISYIKHSLTEKLLNSGVPLVAKEEEAEVTLVARVNTAGVDMYQFGGVVISALYQHTEERGLAKMHIFGYDRGSGRIIYTTDTDGSSFYREITVLSFFGPYQSSY
jgi:hypothetical protein